MVTFGYKPDQVKPVKEMASTKVDQVYIGSCTNGSYDDLLDTQKLFREFRNEGVRAGYAFGLSAFDRRPIAEIVAVVRESDEYAAYVRTTREWAIAHAGMLEDLRVETERLLAEIDAP